MSDEYDPSFSISVKKYDEFSTYDQYEAQTIAFDPSTIELDSITDIYAIMDEINKLSYKIFMYGTLCDSQNRVVQQIEDEFERWRAQKYHEDKIDDKQFKTEKAKERHLMIKYPGDFWKYKNKLSSEQYKLSLLQRVTKSLESYGYKLHDLKDYNLAIERNS